MLDSPFYGFFNCHSDSPGPHSLDVVPEVAGVDLGPERLLEASVESLGAHNGHHVEGDVGHGAVCDRIRTTCKGLGREPERETGTMQLNSAATKQ